MMACTKYHLKTILWRFVCSKYTIIWVIFVYNINDDYIGEMQKCPINRYFRLSCSKWHDLLPTTKFNERYSPFLDSPKNIYIHIYYNHG